MMTLDEILTMWNADSKIDDLRLDDCSRDTAKLHAKYLELLMRAKMQWRAAELKLDQLKKEKHEYFTGRMTKEDMDARGWPYDPFKGASKPLRGDMDVYFNADPDVQKIRSKIDYTKLLIDTLEEIMNNLRWRHATIKNMLEWKRFAAGG